MSNLSVGLCIDVIIVHHKQLLAFEPFKA